MFRTALNPLLIMKTTAIPSIQIKTPPYLILSLTCSVSQEAGRQAEEQGLHLLRAQGRHRFRVQSREDAAESVDRMAERGRLHDLPSRVLSFSASAHGIQAIAEARVELTGTSVFSHSHIIHTDKHCMLLLLSICGNS